MKKQYKNYLNIVVSLVALLCSPGMSFAQVTFQAMGQLPGNTGNFVWAISGNGKVAVGCGFHANGAMDAFRWTEPGGIQRIGGGFASAVNADGSIVAGSYLEPGTTNWEIDPLVAFRWTAAQGQIPLGDLHGKFGDSSAMGVSDDGKIVVGSGILGVPPRDQPFRWVEVEPGSGTGKMTLIKELVERYWTSRIDASNGNCSVLVGTATNDKIVLGVPIDEMPAKEEAFRLVMPEIRFWPSALSTAAGGGPVTITRSLGELPSGSIGRPEPLITAVGRSETTPVIKPIPLVKVESLGDLPGGKFFSNAKAVNANGSVVVGQSFSASGLEAFRWVEGKGMKGLGDLPGGKFESIAMGVDASGRIIVGGGVDSGGEKAIIWTSQHGMRSIPALLQVAGIDFTGWDLTSAIDISYDGQVIVGIGVHNGKNEGWILTGVNQLLQLSP